MNKSETIGALAKGCEIKVVPFANKYVAVSNGTVISLIKKRPKILKPITLGKYVGLQIVHNDGKVKKEYLHRIIARTFLGEPQEGEECAHIDGNRLNSSLENLQWVSRSINHSHKHAHGTAANGEANPMHKLTEDDVRQMREIRKDGLSYSAIAQRFYVSTMTAHRAIKRVSWGHI
jgi:hypothetical protein